MRGREKKETKKEKPSGHKLFTYVLLTNKRAKAEENPIITIILIAF